MKLHIGGTQVREGWKILNAKAAAGVDFVGDIRDLSAFSSGSIETVYASHVFEHVPLGSAASTLSGIRRVLKPGGELLVSVPDLEVLCRALLDPSADPKRKIHLLQMIYGGQSDEWDFHYFGWTEELLSMYLRSVGFSTIERVESFNLFNDYSEYRPYGEPISLNVRARTGES